MKEKDVKYRELINKVYDTITFIYDAKISRLKGNKLIILFRNIKGEEAKSETRLHSNKDARRFRRLILTLIDKI